MTVSQYYKSEEHRRKISETLKGRKLTVEHRQAISKGLTGHKVSEETRQKMSKARGSRKAYTLSEEHKRNIGASTRERWKQDSSWPKLREMLKAGLRTGATHTEKSKRKIAEAKTGVRLGPHSEEHKRRISASHQGIQLSEWDGYTSFEPYCDRFNETVREKVRNQYHRTCVISGKSALQNGQRLTVHHVDGNKQQGCNGIDWRLVPVARGVHTKLHKQGSLLLGLLLISNNRAEMAYCGSAY